jgi:hypothetical protein
MMLLENILPKNVKTKERKTKMKDFIEIGSSPTGESCDQVGEE